MESIRLTPPSHFKYNRIMERFFNNAGPVNREDHSMLPLEARLDVEEILMLIRQKKYYILHTPRQINCLCFGGTCPH